MSFLSTKSLILPSVTNFGGVAQNLLNNKAVVINFSRMEDSSARRIVDFITGTVYALNGEIQRIGDKIFLATPPKFVTDGKISDLVDKKDNLS